MAGKRKDAGAEAALTFRLPRELHSQLVKAADGRSISEEMRRRLEASFILTAPRDPWFDDVLSAITCATAGAIELKRHPILPAGTLDREGARRTYDTDLRGPDTTAYEAFVTAVGALMQALAPHGIPAVDTATGLRLADQLVALALGSLGERGITAFANLPLIDREFMKASGGSARAFADEAERRSEAKP